MFLFNSIFEGERLEILSIFLILKIVIIIKFQTNILELVLLMTMSWTFLLTRIYTIILYIFFEKIYGMMVQKYVNQFIMLENSAPSPPNKICVNLWHNHTGLNCGAETHIWEALTPCWMPEILIYYENLIDQIF